MTDDVSGTEGGPFPGIQERTALEWLMATNDGTAIDSWHWLVEASTTSFYVKSLNPALEGAKVSIHGPDDNHPGEDHFRFDLVRTDGKTLDQRASDKAARAGGRWLTDPSEMPHYFSGRRINNGVRLVVRFSTPWEEFIAGAPAAGGSRWPKEKALKGLVPVPKKGRIRHVDLYLSTNGTPYWPYGEDVLAAAGAGLGYITNALDWKISAVVIDTAQSETTDPVGDLRRGTPFDLCRRGLAAWVDETQLLWLCETVIPVDPPSAPA